MLTAGCNFLILIQNTTNPCKKTEEAIVGHFDPVTENWFQRLTISQRTIFISTALVVGVLLYLGISNPTSILNFLQIGVPLWLVLLLIASITTIGIYRFKTSSSSTNHQFQESREAYTKDKVFEIDWEWNWDSSIIQNLTPICPQCSNELIIETRNWDYGQKSFRETFIECDNCDFEMKSNRERDLIFQNVMKEIERRYRFRHRVNGSFSTNKIFKWLSEI